MNGITLAILIIGIIIGIVILWKVFKPYIIRRDTTMCYVGGLGSSKTLHSHGKDGPVLIRKQRFIHYTLYNNIKRPIINFFIKLVNASHRKYNLNKKHKKIKKIYDLKPKHKMPMLYTNIPVHFKKHMWFWCHEREWSQVFKASHMLCLEEIIEYSVVAIDEFPQFINQFNWNNELIQKNVNEFITFFRHYVGGYLIINAQSIDEVVCQVRRKLNQATWCFDFKKWGWPIPLFYTVRMCDIQLSDEITTISTTFIEDNTRLHFGLFPPRKTYDSRCYSVRYKNIYKPFTKKDMFESLKTSKVLRLVKYTSPLDDTTTETMKQEQWKKGEEIWKN